MLYIVRCTNKAVQALLLFFVLFVSVQPCSANAPSKINSDYVLIINSYNESSDWSNSFIRPMYDALFANKSNITAYAEHMNMLLISNEAQMNQYKDTLFAKYVGTKPRAIVLLGNTPWALFREEIEARWIDVPVMLCAEENYIGPKEAYIEKFAIPQELRVPLADYKGGLNLTIIQNPIYLDSTVAMMKRMLPNMERIMYLSDKRYIACQSRMALEDILKSKYPEIKLTHLVSDDISKNDLSDSLKSVDSKTGILYLSWYRRSEISGSIILTINDYKMFSHYTNQPIFTLTDNEMETTGMLGGCCIDNNRIAEITTRVFTNILTGKMSKKLTMVDCGRPIPVINYKVLTEVGLSEKDCSGDTLFYMKDLTFWELYKYWVLFGFFVILCIISFLALKMRMLARIEKKQAEQILAMKNYSSLFDNMPIAYSKQKIEFDSQGTIVDYIITEVNPYFEKYFVSKECPVGMYGSNADSGKSLKEYIGLYELALNERRAITVQHYHQNTDQYFSMIIVPSKIDGYMDVFYVDNTELSTAQQLLRTLNRKLSMALEVANITPWKWDLEKGLILCDVNRMKDSASDSEADEQLSVPYNEYFSKICKRDLDRVKQSYHDLLSGKINKIKEEYRVFTHQNNKRVYEWVESQAVIDKRDSLGRAVSLIGSSLVISDRKKMELDLVDAKDRAEESNRLKSAFLANMSHEIRTPLNAIVGFSEVLASAENEDEKQEYVSIIENNNTLLLQLISDILDLSKIEAGTLEFNYSDVNLEELFTELETTFAMRMSGTPVEIVFERLIPKCCTHTDKNRLTQVMINIVNNAMKFTTEGSIRFGYKIKDDKTLYFSITDTGCGIPDEKLDSIFGRFVKLNSFVQGTGLGLSICQTIIHNMGGKIGVESKEGEGATFWFTLPYEPIVMVQQPQAEIVQQTVERAKLTVLIAEDNASNFKLFETMLKGEYIILHAWNGEEVVKMFKEHKPHIVLMDINMPKKNGYEATSEIRKISSNVPIIAVTAYAYTSDETKIMDSGFDGYAAKPINSQMLKSQMLSLLNRQLIFI